MTVVRGAPLEPGDHVLGADFDAFEANRWRLSLLVDGEVVDERPEVAMMYGMAPFEGITVGRDPRSPVWWEQHEAHGSFPYTGRQGPVTYVPGAVAPGMPEDVIPLLRQMGAKFE
jgi:arylsulfatase